MNKRLGILFLVMATILWSFQQASENSTFRVKPYLQTYGKANFQITWWSTGESSSEFILFDEQGNPVKTENLTGEEVAEIYYTSIEKNENIPGLDPASWIFPDQTRRFRVSLENLDPGVAYFYQVKMGGETFSSGFQTAPDPANWSSIRFIALSDSETEPLGRVNRRAWYPAGLTSRPSSGFEDWIAKFGTTEEQGFDIINYALTEKEGYEYNLRVINSRLPNFLLMPGDLVQGSGYQPAWDEFWRHNAGEYDQGLSNYPIIPALGNWENFGAKNGSYGFNEKGDFLPKLGRERFHEYFETPSADPLQLHRQSYYRVDYGPVTILTLDSSNGTPDQSRSDFPDDQKLKNQDFTVNGTDTQENYTESAYQAAGGTDLSSFGPGSPQYQWLEANLQEAQESGQLIFVQFHHAAYSSGEHGVPINHELATGQSGVPMRVLHPLFEEFGVVAVLSGHDELFERSFVDLDNDGKGVMYYDVGVAGDGMRGEKRNWISNPLQLLNYNSFKQWTADQNEPEQWTIQGGNPVLTDGGKHYGHLEVNINRIVENGNQFAQIDFSPVYVFPVLDQNYNLQNVERRVYGDEVSLKVLLQSEAFVPELKDSVKLFLDQGGRAFLSPEEVLVEQPDEDFSFEYSTGFQLNCDAIGEQQLIVTSTRQFDGEVFKDTTRLIVVDTIAPYFDAANAILVFDPTVGRVEYSIADFDPVDFSDNCATGPIRIEGPEITCSSFEDPEVFFGEFPVRLIAEDASGNQFVREVKVQILNSVESKKVSLEASGVLVSGQQIDLVLGDELDYEVLGWFFQSSNPIEGETGKTLTIDQPGVYYAKLLLSTGCVVLSEQIEVQEVVDDFPEVKPSVKLALDQNGLAELSKEQVFTEWPISEDIEVSLSESQFSCQDIGEQSILVTLSKLDGAKKESEILVQVVDELPPTLEWKSAEYNFDLSVGELTFDIEDFIVSPPTDNCGSEGIQVSLSKTSVTCADIDSERVNYPIDLDVVVTDASGNTSVYPTYAQLTFIESQKVSLTAQGPLYEGRTVELRLGEELNYDVWEWRKDLEQVPGEKGSSIIVDSPGRYTAVLALENGCLVSSQSLVVEVEEVPFPAVKEAVNLSLNEQGLAVLAVESLFETWPFDSSGLSFELSKSEFGCADLGDNTVQLLITGEGGVEWAFEVLVFVEDKIAPILELRDLEIELDLKLGEASISADDLIISASDNCSELEITLSQNQFDCEDIGKEIVVTVRAEDLAGNVTEANSTISIISLEAEPVTLSGNLEFCQGESSTLSVNATGDFEVVNWTRNGTIIPNENGTSIEVIESGNYQARIRYAGACPSSSDVLAVQVNPLPSGEIEVEGDLLTAPAGDFSYQWYRNGELIDGANSQTYQANLMGEYAVSLTSSAGCSTLLPAVTLTISGLGGKPDFVVKSIKIYPNPATQRIRLEFSEEIGQDEPSIQIFSSEGKEVGSLVQLIQATRISADLDISQLAVGVYWIQLYGENKTVYQARFIKNP
ncbi:T9SS type A sorting domain-containing protein [Algoriphagus formosus]|uniref:T9SS type A sorting domain-containing protein n=1 Tax=Algoriphagus formosus TaxID=2007308 RepID=A0A4R5V7Y2_9BACT|nr:T9SS type A sorting domain-containing protein [Algoriphagus aquimaris]TDK48149.1 T9SS type A sorting domain-containing protein [Algoriphagus aquimaris]